MSPSNPRPIRVAVVGNGRVEDTLSGWQGDAVLDIESVPPAAVVDGFERDLLDLRRTDCVVVDGRAAGPDAVDAAERVERRDADASAVVLTDGWAADRVADAVSSGVTDVLPRSLLSEAPDALVDRVAAAGGGGTAAGASRDVGTVVGTTRDADAADPPRRERVVRRLHDSTEEIQSATTEQEVCAAIVDAAASVLGLAAPTCWTTEANPSTPRRDGQSGPAGADRQTPTADTRSTTTDGVALTPVAGESSVWRPSRDGDGPVRFGAGDPAYDAYDAGSLTTVGADEGTVPDGAEGAVFLPLGRHGVLGAGIPAADSFDAGTRDAATVLARHATTALDRVVRREELRRSERRFRLIADRIDEVIFLSEPDFSEVFYANDAYAEVWGEPVSALYDDPRSFIDAIDSRDRESFDAEFAAMLDDIDRGDPDDRYVFEYRIRPEPDELRWVRATGYPIELDGSDTRFVGIVEDVTESRELEATYRGVFENVSDGLVVHHPETGEICDANQRFCEMNGYDREELIGETVDAVTGPDHGYEAAKERIRAAREEGPQLFEWLNRTKDGETFPVEVHLSVVEIHGEERVLGSVRDISERRSTQRRLSEVLDRIDDAVYITPADNLGDADRGPDYLSAGYEEIWGQPLDGIRDRHDNGFFDTLHPEDRETYRSFVEAMIDEVTGGEPADSYDIEYRIERPDGEVRWVRSEYYPIQWGGGPVRIVVVSRDITERKRTRRNLRTIAERVDEAIYMSSPDKREVYYASPSFEDLWDLPIERVYEDPQAFIDRVHPDDREWFEEEYDRIRADLTQPDREPQDTYELEYRVRHPDGEVRWISVRGYPVFDGAGGVDRWIAVNRDVTDRKARERRIASFDEATEDLATADSAAAAAETAVAEARDTLELPAVGAFLYDEDAGVLRPEALSGALDDAGVGPVEPDGERIWSAFATGTVTGPADDGSGDGGDEAGPLGDLAAWRAIPLGTHGVLVVGSSEGSFESGTIQTAHVLAATLEAALAHLRGQQQLADRERELRTQTERAERLDRIARLTHRVEAAITDATTPGEVERAVCDRLADSGPYGLAWIGGAEVGSDRLTPRAVSGAPTGYVDEMRLDPTDSGADPHPAVEAWRTDEVRAVNSLVGGGPSSEWRRHALSAGYQSVCAVPLTYGGVTHGALTVGTDAPNSFGDREQETLAQLGTSIANALAAIERRRALESDATVELEFRGPGESLPFARAAAAADCRVGLQRTVAAQDGPVSVYFTFEGDVPDDVPEVARRTLPGSVAVVDDEGTVVEARTDEWFGAPLAEYGGMIRDAVADPETTTITVEVPRETDVRSFVERLRDVAPSMELVARRQHGEQERTPAELGDTLGDALTDRQLEVVRTALSAGYFEWPREHDSSEVAGRLDITQPTFNKHLRIAERETFELLFGDDE